MIQFIRYCDDVEVQAEATRLVNNFACILANPTLWTVGAIMRELTRRFGPGARNCRIWVH
jgi:hypothetical protein